MAKGKKTCPKCQKEWGARLQKCKCGYSFISAKKEVPEVIERKSSLMDLKLLDLPEHKHLTPKQHAKRILDYGKEKASLLLQFHKMGLRWSHVDWDVVEEGLI
ncbi:hypothetical protein LCGC14_0608830 [marine sediment metagenome]|uniref:Uncharacterized protein n=1 Tax=marine sediment metagenome TaxID=412755 RepID=A0A0F9RSM2_9ZZZZ